MKVMIINFFVDHVFLGFFVYFASAALLAYVIDGDYKNWQWKDVVSSLIIQGLLPAFMTFMYFFVWAASLLDGLMGKINSSADKLIANPIEWVAVTIIIGTGLNLALSLRFVIAHFWPNQAAINDGFPE